MFCIPAVIFQLDLINNRKYIIHKFFDMTQKQAKPRPDNGPSTTGNPSGGGRGNNDPAPPPPSKPGK
jgi:hypothetical protein